MTEALGLEQRIIRSGHWWIEGYDVKRVENGNGETEWQATKRGSWFSTRATLHEICQDIRDAR